jgi:hypothetical protein
VRLELYLIECRWRECQAWFVICRSCYRGHRYCSQACRVAARKESNTKARKAYEASLEKDPKKRPEDAEAEREDQRRRQKAYRDRVRERKAHEDSRVTEQGRQVPPSTSKMESEGETTSPGPEARPLESAGVAAVPAVTCSIDARTNGTSGRSSRTGCCSICGNRGRVHSRIPAGAGMRRADREPVGDDDDADASSAYAESG